MNDNIKRYNLNLSESLFNQVQEIATERNTTVAELLRRMITLGIIISKPGVTVTIKENGMERDVFFL